MGFSDKTTDSDLLLKCAFKLDVINQMLRSTNIFTKTHIWKVKRYMTEFGVLFCTFFVFNVSKRMHRLVLQVNYHLIILVSLLLGSPEENERLHKGFRCLYNTTNEDIDGIGTAPYILG